MAVFWVTVEEVLSRAVEVEASDEREALRLVEEMYRRGEVVLDASDFAGEAEFTVIG